MIRHRPALPSGVHPPPPLRESLAQASTIVTGTVGAITDRTALLLVDRVLAGSAARSMTINTSDVPPQVGDISAGDRGVWVLNDETPPSVLAGGAHGCSDLEVERLLGGLDQIPPAPTAEHIRVLAAQSVAIVWATFAATDERAAEAVVLKRLKGDTPRELTVTLTPPAGNSFQHFAADDRNRFGVLFLNHPDHSSWSVANGEDPAVYSLELVENALSGMAKTAKVTPRWESQPPKPD